MARKTYVPTFIAILRRIERYIDRWDAQMYGNLTPTQQGQFNAIQTAVKTFLNGIDNPS